MINQQQHTNSDGATTANRIKETAQRGAHRTVILGLATLALGAQVVLVGKPIAGQRMKAFASSEAARLPSRVRIFGYDDNEGSRETVSVAAYGATAEYRQTEPRKDAIAILTTNSDATDGSAFSAQIILTHGFETVLNRGKARRLELPPSTDDLDLSAPTTLVAGDFNPPQSAADLNAGLSADLVIGFSSNPSTLAIVADPDYRTLATPYLQGDPQRPIVQRFASPANPEGHVYTVPFNCNASGCATDAIVSALAAQDLNGDGWLDLAILAEGTIPVDRPDLTYGTYLFICINDGANGGGFAFHCKSRGRIADQMTRVFGSGSKLPCSSSAGSNLTSGAGDACQPHTVRRAFSQTLGLTELPHAPGEPANFIGIATAESSVYVIRFAGDIDRSNEDATVEQYTYPAHVVTAALIDYNGDHKTDLATQLQPSRELGQTNPDIPDFANHPYSYLHISNGVIGYARGWIVPIVSSDELRGKILPAFDYRIAIPMLISDFVNQDPVARQGNDRLAEIVAPSRRVTRDPYGGSSYGPLGLPVSGISNPFLSYSELGGDLNELHPPKLAYGAVGEFMPMNLYSGNREAGVYRPDIAVVTKPNGEVAEGEFAYRDVFLSANPNVAASAR